MKKVLPLVKIAVPILAIVAGIALAVKFVPLTPEDTGSQLAQVQCAHWSIFRCSQLLGVPIGMDYLTQKLPYQEKGHSMLQMSKVLNEIGFETEGRKETIQTLSNQQFPCIAHLTNPSHFVVVSGIDDKYVHVFDESGNRIAREHVHFTKQWSGNVLLVSKPSTAQRLPAFLSPPKGDVPLAEFESLIRDLGTVPAVGEPVVFRYNVKNVGRSDLIIKKIRPDCTCIESKKPEAPIKPGEVGTIDLLYHVQPQRGPFSHVVLIETNDPQIPMQAVMASGWSGVELRVEPPRIALPDLVRDQAKTYRCFVQYTGEGQDLRVQIENSSLEGASLVSHVLKPVTKEVVAEWFPEFAVKSSAYNQAYVLDLTFLPKGDAGDSVSGKIILGTSIKGYEQFTLDVTGRIETPIRLFPEIVSLHDIEKNDIVLASRIDEPFTVVAVTQEHNNLTWKGTNASEGEKTMSLFLDNSALDISLDKPINIKVDYPQSGKRYDLPIKVIL